MPRFLVSLSSTDNATPKIPDVLRNTVYLLGIHFSKSGAFMAHESVFLDKTLRCVHYALSVAQEQQTTTLYVLQAEILLAYYFYHNNRLVEGKFHASAAVSLAMLCKLHKTHSYGNIGVLPITSAWLSPSNDAVEADERIRGWWQTYVLDKSWAVALVESSSIIEENDDPATVVDTPWPEINNNVSLSQRLLVTRLMLILLPQTATVRAYGGRTLQVFFEGTSGDTNISTFGLHAQAVALYERASKLSSYQDRSW